MRTLFTMLVGVALTLLVPAAGADVITLKDGTRINGSVVSYAGGNYTIDSSALGRVTVARDSVVEIQKGGEPGNPIGQAASASVESIQSSLMGNPDTMARLLALANDPDMRAVLADPAVMRAVQSMDFEALAAHPRIQALLRNKAVRDIQSELR